MPEVRLARPDGFDALPALEQAADEIFVTVGISAVFDPATPAVYAAALAVLVVGDPPFGRARIEEVDGAAHLEQLAVHPAQGRHCVGRALVEAACQWAIEHGYRAMTLVTYRYIAWNGPFYASAGFSAVSELSPGLAEVWREDTEDRPARYGSRVVMRRALAP